MTRRRIAIVGLQSTGKSRVVNALQGKPGAPTEPTSGANKSSVVRDGETYDLLDLGGAPAVRKFWAVLAADADALVAVVNASEADDIAWAMLARELRALRAASSKGSVELPVLVLLNRLGVAERLCAPPLDALDRLGLAAQSRRVRVEQLASSEDAVAAEAGLAWLCDALLHPVDDGATAPAGGAGGMASGAESAADAGARELMAGAPLPSLGRMALMRSLQASHASSAAADGAPTHAADASGRPAPGGDGGGDDEHGGDDHGGGGPASRRGPRAMRAVREAKTWADDTEDDLAVVERKLEAGMLLSEEELEVLRAKNRGD